MAREAGIDHPFDLGMTEEPGGDGGSIGAMPLHAQGERLEAAQGQEAVEGARHRTDRVLEKGETLGKLAVLADRDDAPHHVRMAVQVLGRRMEDQVEAELERALRPGCRESRRPR